MSLYRATKNGNVLMSAEEETVLRAEWALEDSKPKVKHKTLDERVTELELQFSKLPKP